MTNPDIDKLADSARKLRELEAQTTQARDSAELEAVTRLRLALEAAQQHDINAEEGEAIARQFNNRLEQERRAFGG